MSHVKKEQKDPKISDSPESKEGNVVLTGGNKQHGDVPCNHRCLTKLSLLQCSSLEVPICAPQMPMDPRPVLKDPWLYFSNDYFAILII